MYDILPPHENSAEHSKQYLAWKFLLQSLKRHGIDKDLQLQIQCETTKWRALLQQIVDVTLFLLSRSKGLAFQGDNTTIEDVHNGNFLRILKLIGKYDEVTRQHLAVVQQNQVESKCIKDMHIICHGILKMSLLTFVQTKFSKPFLTKETQFSTE